MKDRPVRKIDQTTPKDVFKPLPEIRPKIEKVEEGRPAHPNTEIGFWESLLFWLKSWLGKRGLDAYQGKDSGGLAPVSGLFNLATGWWKVLVAVAVAVLTYLILR